MKVIIYGKPNCPNCTKAKNICETNNFDYEYKTVGVDITVEQLRERCGPVKSVPQIFVMVDGFAERVGGYSDFEKYIKGQ